MEVTKMKLKKNEFLLHELKKIQDLMSDLEFFVDEDREVDIEVVSQFTNRVFEIRQRLYNWQSSFGTHLANTINPGSVKKPIPTEIVVHKKSARTKKMPRGNIEVFPKEKYEKRVESHVALLKGFFAEGDDSEPNIQKVEPTLRISKNDKLDKKHGFGGKVSDDDSTDSL